MLLKERIRRELDKIAAKNNGNLRREDVVEFAKNPKTALHSQFDWDDTIAAQKWRLEQASMIIRFSVKVIEGSGDNIRAFVSLTTERGDGTYRTMDAVINDPKLLEQLEEDVLTELQRYRNKYSTLKRLSGVWAAVDEVTVKKPDNSKAVKQIGVRHTA